MDKRVEPIIRWHDIEEVKGVVARLTTRKRSEQSKSRWVVRVENAERMVRKLALIGLAECAVFALLSRAWDSHPLTETVLVMSILVTLLVIALLISPMVMSIPFFRKVYRAPFTPLIEALDDAIKLDFPMVLELDRCDREAIEYVLAHYRHQRIAFERRGMMLAGSLDKIGFFPAMVAFVMLMIPTWGHLDPWIKYFALLVPAFHFLNMLSYGITQEMDRTIALLEYCLEARGRQSE